MKKLLLVAFSLIITATLASCVNKAQVIKWDQEITGDIVVGNTAATTGSSAVVGVPFNDLMKVVFDDYNKKGGFSETSKIVFKHYDDKFEPSIGKTYTEKLVEEDKAFAITGHFGTKTVNATWKYLQKNKIPMVYAATGINDLYSTDKVGNSIMPVQPIYKTDGQIMLARAFKESLYGTLGDEKFPTNGKIGVIYSSGEDGRSLLEGIELEAKTQGISGQLEKKMITESDDSSISAAVNSLKGKVASIIIAANQDPFVAVVNKLEEAKNTTPVFTSYVNSTATILKPQAFSFDVYSSAWLDIFSPTGYIDFLAYIAMISESDFSDDEKTAYMGNPYAIAGYVAASIFVEGLNRVKKNVQPLTRKNFVMSLEETPVNIPMGGTVNFSNGSRIGIDQMSLLKYAYTAEVAGDPVIPAKQDFIKVREIESLETINKK